MAADAIAQRSAQLDTQSADLARRQSELLSRETTLHQQQDTELRPVEEALLKETNQPLPERQHVQMPALPDIKSVVNGKDYEGLSSALIGLALIGGATSHGNWLGVSSTLNGALKGWHEGNVEQAKTMLDQYDREFKAAKEREDQFNKQYQDILDNRNMSINQKLQQIRVIAAQHGRQDVMIATQQKSLDAVARQIESGRNMVMNAQSRHDMMQERLAAARERLAAGGGYGRGMPPKTPEGMDLAAEAMTLGVPVSFYGGKGAMWDDLAAKGVKAADIASGKVNLAAQTAGARQATIRLQGVERLTKSVTTLENRVVDLAKKNGNAQAPAWNATMNTVKRNLGDGTLQELQTLMGSVGRQYTEAVTMPGSNAQMHATAQEWAQGIFNENMSLEQIQGSIRGMNAEIEATSRALKEQQQEALHLGQTPGGAPAPAGGAAPVSLDEYLKKQGF